MAMDYIDSEPECIVIDHRNDRICGEQPINHSLNDNQCDIKIIVENSVFNTHTAIIECIADKRELVKRNLNFDDKDIYAFSGLKAKPFEMFLRYVYERYISCDHNEAIQLILTLIKLNFIGLAKEIAIKFCLPDDRCHHCGYRLTIYNCDDIYHIASYHRIDYYPLIAKSRIFLSRNSIDISREYMRIDYEHNDPTNCVTFMYITARYCNYIEFEIPEPFIVYFNIMISTDRHKWTKIVDNDNIACESWNWFYFRETRVKYIRVTCVLRQTDGTETPFNVRKHFDNESFCCKYVNTYLKFDEKTNYLVPSHNAIEYPHKDTKHLFSENLFTYCMSNSSEEMKEKYYYYHFIGDGKPLYFYLPQTCFVNAIRFRLWDIDNRTYDYAVCVKSYDNNVENEWQLIGTYKDRRSWQTIEFDKYLAIRWISITGLKAPDYDREFAVIDIQCPPQDVIYKNKRLVSSNSFYYDR